MQMKRTQEANSLYLGSFLWVGIDSYCWIIYFIIEEIFKVALPHPVPSKFIGITLSLFITNITSLSKANLVEN